MNNKVTKMLQLVFSAGERHAKCGRSVCRRYRRCVPPPHVSREGLFACPFDREDDWDRRSEAACTLVERLMHAHDQGLIQRGLPPRFAAKPQPGPRDHLDLSKPLDLATLELWPDPPGS